uniref:Histidine-containing phosphotransfer protein n=1 Tax=Cajanus cajan TaxID=3821 RepID=A0A151RK66_CAJCA|nr:Histidine-containing phosphotransfer protein 4 [Cajanus cajan]
MRPFGKESKNKIAVRLWCSSGLYKGVGLAQSGQYHTMVEEQVDYRVLHVFIFSLGFLDEQFVQLEELQDDVNPNFVEEIVTLFYTDSVRLIYNIERALMSNPPNFTKLDDYMHQFKGSCSSIGAKKVKIECTKFSEYCAAENFEGCFRTFQQINLEYTTLKKKLETYFQVSHV